MTPKIKLRELMAARSKMNPAGKWTSADVENDGHPFLGIKQGARVIAFMAASMESDDNADGIVATHNAADVLIEIAQAAIEALALKPNTRVFGDAMRGLRAACSKVEP